MATVVIISILQTKKNEAREIKQLIQVHSEELPKQRF